MLPCFRPCECRRPDGERKYPHNYPVIGGAVRWVCRACLGLHLPAWHPDWSAA